MDSSCSLIPSSRRILQTNSGNQEMQIFELVAMTEYVAKILKESFHQKILRRGFLYPSIIQNHLRNYHPGLISLEN